MRTRSAVHGSVIAIAVLVSACRYKVGIVYRGGEIPPSPVQAGAGTAVDSARDERPHGERRGQRGILTDDRHLKDQSAAYVVTAAIRADLLESRLFTTVVAPNDARYVLTTDLLSLKTEQSESPVGAVMRYAGGFAATAGLYIAYARYGQIKCTGTAYTATCSEQGANTSGLILSALGSSVAGLSYFVTPSRNMATVVLRTSLVDKITGRVVWGGTFSGRQEFQMVGRNYQQAVDSTLSPALAQANARLVAGLRDFFHGTRRVVDSASPSPLQTSAPLQAEGCVADLICEGLRQGVVVRGMTRGQVLLVTRSTAEAWEFFTSGDVTLMVPKPSPGSAGGPGARLAAIRFVRLERGLVSEVASNP